jgi:hypothetical protein
MHIHTYVYYLHTYKHGGYSTCTEEGHVTCRSSSDTLLQDALLQQTHIRMLDIMFCCVKILLSFS